MKGGTDLHRAHEENSCHDDHALENDLANAIRTIPDYPKPGIMFRDITTLLGDARAFRRAVDELVQPWAGMKIDKVAGIEARGFILGGAVAHQVSAGFVPIRKKGKLPHKRVSIAYSLEYGIDEMEMHEDAVVAGERVMLVDDLIATGGTAEGAVKLLRQLGADVLAACFVIDLPELGGADKLRKLGRAGAHADLVRGALSAGSLHRPVWPQGFRVCGGSRGSVAPSAGAGAKMLSDMFGIVQQMPVRPGGERQDGLRSLARKARWLSQESAKTRRCRHSVYVRLSRSAFSP